MAKQKPKPKIITKVGTFEDVQRSLQELEKRLNELSLAVNQSAESQSIEGKGESGDLKMIQNANKSYSLEGCTDDGWKRLYSGEGDNKVETFFSDKQANLIKPVATVNKWDSMPRPDYDSGWFTVGRSKQYVTGATTGVVPDDAYFYHAAHIVGIPALGFSFTSAPVNIQVHLAPYGVKTFDDVMSSKVLILDWQNQYYYAGKSMGIHCWMSSPEHICFTTADNFIYHAEHYGGLPVRSDNANFHDAFDSGGSEDAISMLVRLWK